MKLKTLTAIFFTAILAASVASQTQRPTVGLEATLINTDPVPVQSGEDAEIRFKIRNTGNTEARGVTVSIQDSFPFELKPDRQRNYSLGKVAPGQEYQISTEMLVSDRAPDGMNDLKVRISNQEFSRVLNVPIQVQSEDIELNIANLKTTPSELMPDTEDAKLTVEVVNNGEKTAENVVINTALPDSFQKTSSFSTRQALGNLAAGEVKEAEFTFDIEKSAESGDITIPTNLTYSTGDSSTKIVEEASFSFYLAGKPQFQVSSVESNLKTGKTQEIRLRVENTGSEESESTRIRVLDSSDLPFSYASSSQYVGSLDPGEKGTAVFEVTTESDAAVKDYLLDFEVTGVQDTEVFVEDETIKFGVEDGGSEGSKLPMLPIAAVFTVISGFIIYFREQIISLIQKLSQ